MLICRVSLKQRAVAALRSFLQELPSRAFAPVDNASLIFFRIAFGLLLTWEVCRYFQFGWIEGLWIEPRFYFTYYGFSWVHPWPGRGMYIHWVALGVLALFIAAGFLYRCSTLLFFLGFTYCFLLDQSTYLNHFYLVCLLSFLLIFVPAHRAVSIDAWLRPRLRAQTAPAWALWALRLQWAVVYFFGGIAKISPDWLRGEPMRSWLAARSDFPVVGRYFREEWAVYLVSYTGLLLDLLIAPLLLWRRTRIVAFVIAVVFHLTNARLFHIGIFPWLGIAGTLLFLPADWPRRVWRFCRRSGPAISVLPSEISPPPAAATLVLCLLGIYFAVQLLMPLRHLLYPGRVEWTFEGHRFSWRMKLVDRKARARFYLVDDEHRKVTEVNPRSILRPHQASRMAGQPDMLLQFAHHLAAGAAANGGNPPRVHAHVIMSLNGRKPELLVDDRVNLASEPRTLGHFAWLLPMKESLPVIRTEDTKREKPETNTGEAE